MDESNAFYQRALANMPKNDREFQILRKRMLEKEVNSLYIFNLT